MRLILVVVLGCFAATGAHASVVTRSFAIEDVVGSGEGRLFLRSADVRRAAGDGEIYLDRVTSNGNLSVVLPGAEVPEGYRLTAVTIDMAYDLGFTYFAGSFADTIEPVAASFSLAERPFVVAGTDQLLYPTLATAVFDIDNDGCVPTPPNCIGRVDDRLVRTIQYSFGGADAALFERQHRFGLVFSLALLDVNVGPDATDWTAALFLHGVTYAFYSSTAAFDITYEFDVVPLPAGAALMGTALVLAGAARFRRKALKS